MCPSAPDAGAGPPCIAVYCGVSGVDFPGGINPPPSTSAEIYFDGGTGSRKAFGHTNYLANGGDWRTDLGIRYRYRGPFYWKSKERISNILDGTSNTLFFGEAAGSGDVFNLIPWPGSPTSIPNPAVWAGYSWAVGPQYTAFGLGTEEFSGAKNYGKFSSKHPNLIQFAYADGSVRQFSNVARYNTNAFAVLRAVGGMNDGVNFEGID